jgi:hypothetical protein
MHTLKILHDHELQDYANRLVLVLESQDVHCQCGLLEDIHLQNSELGNPDVLLQNFSALLIVLDSKLLKNLYNYTGLRATLDKTIMRHPEKVFIVLTDDSWVPGIKLEQVYVDLRQRCAPSIAIDLMQHVDSEHNKGSLPLYDFPDIVHTSRSHEEVEQYLLDLCDISRKAGILTFGAIIYNEENTDLQEMIRSRELVQKLDIAAGPYLDVFGIKDTMEYQSTGSANVLLHEHKTSSPSIGYSGFIAEYFNSKSTQIHYPSFILFLIEDAELKRSIVVPLIYLRATGFHDQLMKLFQRISTTMLEWRKFEKYMEPELWDKLVGDITYAGFPIHQHKPPANTREAIRSFSKSIEYF